MATKKRSPKFQRMAHIYEQTLRRLLAEAEDEARLYTHLRGSTYNHLVTEGQIATHDTLQHVRIVAAYALRQFHPEIE
jgi:hypothetical protein